MKLTAERLKKLIREEMEKMQSSAERKKSQKDRFSDEIVDDFGDDVNVSKDALKKIDYDHMVAVENILGKYFKSKADISDQKKLKKAAEEIARESDKANRPVKYDRLKKISPKLASLVKQYKNKF